MSGPDRTDQWLRLLGQEADEKAARSLVVPAVGELELFLRADPHTEQRVVDILGRRLGGEITPRTWEDMNNSLSQYFTDELAYLLYWVVAVENPNVNRVKEVEEFVSPIPVPVKAFLRSVVGVYGPDLSRAFMRAQTPNDWHNWRNFQREVHFDLINQAFIIRVRISKNNDEEMVIEGPPDFVLNLAAALVYTATLVGSPDAFSPPSVELFRDEATKFDQMMSAGDSPEPS